MNLRGMQVRTLSSLLKLSTKKEVTQILPALQIIREKHFPALRSIATSASAAAAKRQIESIVSYATYVPDDATIAVHLPQTGESVFPTNWLRDNCQCPQCFHQDTQSRIIHLLTFDPNVAPKNITTQDNTLSITWEDGHQSCYSYGWLAERSFNPHAQEKWLTDVYRIPKIPWTAKDFNNILYKTNFDDVMNDNDKLKNWLEKLSIYGVAVVNASAEDSTCIRQLAKRIGFLRQTHYGETYSFKAKPGTTNVAFMSANLQLHTDLPYYHYKPGAQMLHCLVQDPGAGGENLLADVLPIAEEFRKNDPESFSVLTTTAVDWNDIGQEDGNYFYKIHRDPVISLDRWGNVERINFAQPQRDSHFSVPIEQVTPWYNAMQKFVVAIHSGKFCVKYKMEPGEILTFDNTRLVHGRAAFEENSNRHVLGAFLDWDEIRSRLRVLQNSA